MSVPQSLPSFAQAFSSSSLSEIAHISNALPPIHSPPATKKRTRTERASVDAADAPRHSPVLVRIKEEDGDDRPPGSPPHHSDPPRDDATPAVQSSSKKRRVTVGAIPPAEPIPISPTADDPPRPMPKQLPKAPRENLSAPMVSGSLLSASPPGDPLAASKLARMGPTTIPVVNRPAGSQPITPPPLLPAEPTSKPQQVAAAHSLPPPPISFARRRAAQPGGRKKKPADILISPRGAGPSDPLAPVIQSAPPVADPGRFPMAIPRLPIVMSSAQTTRRVASNVPPTPTRFSLQGTSAPSISSTARTVPSPPNLSVPIASTLVPPTPHALHHPGYSGDKSAFLAPFEVFYDALNGSKQLKSWLSDQLQKSNTLMMTLKQQQERMDEIVADLVETRTRVMREEIAMLRQRMESLEEALLAVRAESSTRRDDDGYGYPQGAEFHQNGAPLASETTSYRSEQRRPDTIIRVISPEGEHPSSVSPPVDLTRRPSVSATGVRPEPQGLHSTFSLGGHSRSASGSQGSTKGTPPVRPPPLPERSSAARPMESRTPSRVWSYGNGNPPETRGDKP